MTSSHTPRLPIQAPEGIKSPVATATIADTDLQGLQTINGYQLNVNDRVLVMNQVEPTQNGIYSAQQGRWTRTQDWKVGFQIANGVLVLDINTGVLWRASFAGVLKIDVTPVTFTAVVSGAGSFKFIQEDLPLNNIEEGDQWYKPSEATTYIYYVDEDGGQWVEQSVQSAEGTLRDELAAVDSDVSIAGVVANKIAKSVDYLTPEQFFIAGEIDSTAMLMRLNDALTDGCRVEFQEKEYLVSYLGTGLNPYASTPYGVSLLNIENLDNVTLNGNNCTIRCVDHDIGTNGGFLFLRGSAAQSPRIKDFNFDMSFVGVNTSDAYYPWCGAIVFFDEATGIKTRDQLCQNILIENCKFKLYHPYGGFALSGGVFDGDPNNGYKLFSIFVSGDNVATSKSNQNNNVRISDCTWLDGHNGYGVWVWAYNNVRIENPLAESWVFKYSDADGNFVGGNIPFIRYHQFYNRTISIDNIQFNAKPCNSRVGTFTGSSRAIGFNTNLNSANLKGGDMIVNGGSIIAGNGDGANSQEDILVFCNAYGRLVLDGGILFDGIEETVNANNGGAVLQYSSESSGGTGYGEVHIGDVKLGASLDRLDNFQILNGASNESDRRCKLLTISDVCSMGQLQYFLDTDGGSTATAKGVEEIHLGDILIDGSQNSIFDPSSTNSRAFRFAGVAGDYISGNNVRVKGKYYEFLTSGLAISARFTFDSYSSESSTLRVLGSKVPILNIITNGTPEGVETAAVGSTAKRVDGSTSATLYIKETGSGNTGWVAK